MLTLAELAALPLKPVPPEASPNVPITPTRLMLWVGELLDSSVPKLTVEPNAPLVVTLIAPPVPVTLTVPMVSVPTAVPLKPKNPGVLPTFKPRTVLPMARSTPLPAVVTIAGEVPAVLAKVVYAAVLLPSAVNSEFNATPSPISFWLLSKLTPSASVYVPVPVRSEMMSPPAGRSAAPVLAVLKLAMLVNGCVNVPRLREPGELLLMNQAFPVMVMVTVASLNLPPASATR